MGARRSFQGSPNVQSVNRRVKIFVFPQWSEQAILTQLTMFARIFTLLTLSMATMVSGLPASTVTGGSCNTGTLECCKFMNDKQPSSSAVQTLLGLLNIPIGSVTAQV